MVAGRRSYSGDAIDATYQYISERPELDEQAEKVEYASDPEPQGEERTEGVPQIGDDQEVERPDVEGQSTLEDFVGWSE